MNRIIRPSDSLRCLIAVALLLIGTVCLAQPPRIRVGILTDGPADRELFSAKMIEQELTNVAATNVEIVFPADKRYVADWTLESVNAELDKALADKDVDVLLTLGILASDQAARRNSLSKPVIATLVIDPVLQRYPLVNGHSGRKNFTYVADFQRIEDSVQMFRKLVGFKHLAVLIDSTLLHTLPEVTKKVAQLSVSLQASISVVPVTNDPAAALAALPTGADAVFVTGLLRFNQDAIGKLAGGLAARRLPSFSTIGRSELDSGLMMATGGGQRDTDRLARRILLAIQRIADGEDPADFEVGFPTERKLMINMRTAREVGFSPRWQDLADAEQIDAASSEQQESLTLLDAMRAALAANPALAASRARLESSADDVRIARSSLLPSLDASASRTQIDADRASPLTQAEKTVSTSIAAQQVIYSESAWANYSISRSLHEASRQSERQDMLDTLESTATAYLNLLRAKSIEVVRASNVQNTRKNLETARVRESVGLGGRSDRLRWIAELARDKQDLLAAESSRRQAETELARIIHRPATAPFTTVESDLDGPLALVSSQRVQALVDTPSQWAMFTEYAAYAAHENSPEIAASEAVITSRNRAVTAARRAYFIPDLAIVSNGSKSLQRTGAGSTATFGAPDNESWSVSLQASLPIFTGGLRKAQLSQARHELRASEADRLTAADAVEARTRAALQRTSSSYPAIALSGEAAAAANENLAMVTDAYGRGVVSITDLIDAQDTALSAGLAAADAKYTFLTDFVTVLRAMGEFEILLEPQSRAAWINRVEAWFRDHGVPPKHLPR
jgi:outer membrane protein